MGASISYKRSTTVKLKVVGYVDCEHNSIITDDGEITFDELFRDFDGLNVDFLVGVKDEESLDLPKGGE